jgi:hypothetical protein
VAAGKQQEAIAEAVKALEKETEAEVASLREDEREADRIEASIRDKLAEEAHGKEVLLEMAIDFERVKSALRELQAVNNDSEREAEELTNQVCQKIADLIAQGAPKELIDALASACQKGENMQAQHRLPRAEPASLAEGLNQLKEMEGMLGGSARGRVKLVEELLNVTIAANQHEKEKLEEDNRRKTAEEDARLEVLEREAAADRARSAQRDAEDAENERRRKEREEMAWYEKTWEWAKENPWTAALIVVVAAAAVAATIYYAGPAIMSGIGKGAATVKSVATKGLINTMASSGLIKGSTVKLIHDIGAVVAIGGGGGLLIGGIKTYLNEKEEEAKEEEARQKAQEKMDRARAQKDRQEEEEKARKREAARRRAEEETRGKEEVKQKPVEGPKPVSPSRGSHNSTTARDALQAKLREKRAKEAQAAAIAQKKVEEEAKRKAEENAKQREELRRKAEEEAKKQEEEEESRRQGEAKRQAEEEARHEEDRRKQEAAKRKLEEETRGKEEAPKQEAKTPAGPGGGKKILGTRQLLQEKAKELVAKRALAAAAAREQVEAVALKKAADKKKERARWKAKQKAKKAAERAVPEGADGSQASADPLRDTLFGAAPTPTLSHVPGPFAPQSSSSPSSAPSSSSAPSVAEAPDALGDQDEVDEAGMEDLFQDLTGPSFTRDLAKEIQAEVRTFLSQEHTKKEAQELAQELATMLHKMQVQHSGLEEVVATERTLRDLCARYELAVPGPKPAPFISPKAIGRAINQAMELLVPGNDLLQIALGNKAMPTTAKGRIELFISTALDFMPGGKLMRLFKSTAVRKVQGHLLKMASKGGKMGRKAMDVSFLDKKELAKRLKISVDKVHDVKKDIVKSFRDILNKKGITNPDICVDKTGNIVLRHPATKETIITNVPLSSFEK